MDLSVYENEEPYQIKVEAVKVEKERTEEEVRGEEEEGFEGNREEGSWQDLSVYENEEPYQIKVEAVKVEKERTEEEVRGGEEEEEGFEGNREEGSWQDKTEVKDDITIEDHVVGSGQGFDENWRMGISCKSNIREKTFLLRRDVEGCLPFHLGQSDKDCCICGMRFTNCGNLKRHIHTRRGRSTSGLCVVSDSQIAVI